MSPRSPASSQHRLKGLKDDEREEDGDRLTSHGSHAELAALDEEHFLKAKSGGSTRSAYSWTRTYILAPRSPPIPENALQRTSVLSFEILLRGNADLDLTTVNDETAQTAKP